MRLRIHGAIRRLVIDTGECWAPHLAEQACRHCAATDVATRKDSFTETVTGAFCLANQYSCVLKNARVEAGKGPNLSASAISSASSQEGAAATELVVEVAGTALRTGEYCGSLASAGSAAEPAGLHAVLLDLVLTACAGFYSAAEMGARMRGARPADRGEFDSSCTAAVHLIRLIEDQIPFPFAQKATLWGTSTYDRGRIVRAEHGRVLDGFDFALPTDVFGVSRDDLGSLFRSFIDRLIRTPADVARRPRRGGADRRKFSSSCRLTSASSACSRPAARKTTRGTRTV